MYTLSSNMLKWSYYKKMSEGQHFEGVSHSMGYYSMVTAARPSNVSPSVSMDSALFLTKASVSLSVSVPKSICVSISYA